MKRILLTFITVLGISVSFQAKAQVLHEDESDFMDMVVNDHYQIFDMSCIPSVVEMVLKYHEAVDLDYYDLQIAWKNKLDGSFQNFHGKELNGITFYQEFVLPRDESFPIDSLFQTIENELQSGRKVVISLPSGPGWHMYVINKQTPDGEFVGYSKSGPHTLIVRNIKERVRQSHGTEIMTYKN